ncbi:MAG: DNA alkylation repair protein [bacterium]|nr:DNA alkylation repair protein [bacterium]
MTSQPFTELINRAAIRQLARRLEAAGRAFDSKGFVRSATSGLSELELKDRVRHVAAALREHLEPDYKAALRHILDSLDAPLAGTEAVTQGMLYWPFCHFVEEYGLDHFRLSMDAIYHLTQRFSCEFAIRPYLDRDPKAALRLLRKWMEDPNVHVRRLCSEGTRTRLPWGAQLRGFREEPSQTRFLIDHLVDDEELFVRRSVANHLNDITKDHPDYAIEIARAWLKKPSENRRWVVRHAMRSLVKKGHPGALELLGFGRAEVEVNRFSVAPKRVTLGESVTIELELVSRSKEEQRLLIDYAVHFRHANGKLQPKVFKWSQKTLPASGELRLTKRHGFRQVTTRRFHAGEHAVEVLINGEARGKKKIRLDL